MNSRGSAVMLVLLALTLLGALVLAGLELSTLVEDSAYRRQRSAGSFYLAQAGVEAAIGDVFSPSSDWSSVPVPPLPETAFGAGFMRVEAAHLERDRAELIAFGWMDGDTLQLRVTLERAPTGGVAVTAWQDPRSREWPS